MFPQMFGVNVTRSSLSDDPRGSKLHFVGAPFFYPFSYSLSLERRDPKLQRIQPQNPQVDTKSNLWVVVSVLFTSQVDRWQGKKVHRILSSHGATPKWCLGFGTSGLLVFRECAPPPQKKQRHLNWSPLPLNHTVQ